MIELFPTGFEEVDHPGGEVELAAYTDAGGEERLWHAFGGTGSAADVEDGWEERWRAFHRPVRVGGRSGSGRRGRSRPPMRSRS